MILMGDCLDQMKTLPDNSIDSIVTDPPYGLSFMGKKWDYSVPSVEIWREALRVLKPGGHLLAFGGTRTYHRLVVNIEDAGFEIRDQVMWIYGSGFPKSMNIGKAIDKQNGTELEVVGEGRSGSSSRAYQSEEQTTAGKYTQTKSSSEWSGWGTALKPANEPICVARKPIEKGLTVAENVIKWGTGSINIDESRISPENLTEADIKKIAGRAQYGQKSGSGSFKVTAQSVEADEAAKEDIAKRTLELGRWPANVIFDEDAAAELDFLSGDTRAAIEKTKDLLKRFIIQTTGTIMLSESTSDQLNKFVGREIAKGATGASRFFYVAKASKRERNAGLDNFPTKEVHRYGSGIGEGIDPNAPSKDKNFHPTVKPIKLMEYLIKLVTPSGGTVLDPFMGSGTTGIACKKLGYAFIGCELNPEYIEIAEKRIESAGEAS